MPSGLILGIESSCDETAAAVVERGSRTLSSEVASQIATHARYGGVVPELASREHLRAIVPVVRAALEQAEITLADLDALAVTSGPGLAGALLVGITYAKALAFSHNLPLIAVNHLEGHIHAVLLNERESAKAEAMKGTGFSHGQGGEAGPSTPPFAKSANGSAPHDTIGKSNEINTAEKCPFIRYSLQASRAAQDDRALFLRQSTESEEAAGKDEPSLALVVSGGHTHLYLVRPAHGVWSYTLIGRTVDDAAGEAYDKVAKLLGLGYPGGPWIDSLARFGNPQAVPFSFAQIKPKVHLGNKPPRTKAAKTAPIAKLDPHFLFSFSGIKTAVLRYVELHGLREEAQARAERLFPAQVQIPGTRDEALAICPQPTLDLIASFQHAVVGDLMKKTFGAAEATGATRILVTGGVAANRELRECFTSEAARRGLRIAFPAMALSTDNAAMIAAAAWPRLQARQFAPQDLTADPSLTL